MTSTLDATMALGARLLRERKRARRYAQRNGHVLGDFVRDGYDGASRYVCVCLQCGRRVIVGAEDDESDVGLVLIEGAATFKPCEPRALRALEGGAWVLGQSPLLLQTRLHQAIRELDESEQARFDPGEFQHHYQRWVSDDGMRAVQWKLRIDPLLPISTDNPQCAWGIVELHTLVDEDELMPARYVGARVNPNEEGDEEEWHVEPLRPHECGLAYRDDEGQWRFKRHDGTTGFFVALRDLLFERSWLDVEPDENEGSTNEGIAIDVNDPAFYP